MNKEKTGIYDVIIIGGGPAGFTAGIYTSRARLKSLLVESFTIPSQAGMTDLVENYPGFPEGISGFELIEKFRKQAGRFGLETISNDVSKIEQGKDTWILTVDGKKYSTLSLIIATGAKPNKLNIPGENEFRGKGVSYCATCDGAFFKNKNIIVVGGGDTAVQEAIFLTKYGNKITLVHRRDRLRANKFLQEKAIAVKKIEFIWDSEVIEILGNNKVESVKIKNIKSQQKSTVACDGVFIFTGYSPTTDLVRSIIDLDEDGYIIIDDNMKTSKDGIFTCGDCRKKKLRQIVNACGDGAVAAFSAQQYVEELKGIAYK